MKSPFPVTPTMRYERMLLAAIASGTFFYLGVSFGSMSVQLADAAPMPGMLGLGQGTSLLRFALFASAGTTFTLLGIAFLLFTVIKFEPHDKARYHHLFARVRRVGLFLAKVAFCFAALWFVANVAIALLPRFG